MRHETLTWRCSVSLFALLAAYSARAAIDMDTAGQIYEAAAIREQVRPTLTPLPKRMREMFAVGSKTTLTPMQGDALEQAAARGFTVSVFEPSALSAMAENFDAASAKKALAFLRSGAGARMVKADEALASLDPSSIDRVMTGEIKAPGTPRRDVLFEKLERAAHLSESAAEVFFSLSDAVAIGTAIGAGTDPLAAAEQARAGDAGQAEMATGMRESLRRYMAYGYRDLSDEDLKTIVAYLESKPGMRYAGAYAAAMAAGYKAMGKRAGEQIGGALRELAQTQAQNLAPASKAGSLSKPESDHPPGNAVKPGSVPKPPAPPREVPAPKSKPLQDTPLPEQTPPAPVLPPDTRAPSTHQE